MKAKHQPPVWMMVREAFTALNCSATRRDLSRYIQDKYPGTKANTISCQITICTVNNPVRIQFQQNSKPRLNRNQYDFLYQTPDGPLVEYSPLKHGVWEISGKHGEKLSIQRVSGPADGARLHVFFCGAPSQNDDYGWLGKMAESGRSTSWSGLKIAQAGDRVLFYTVKERRAFMASGWILSNAQATNDPTDYPYRARVGGIQLFGAPVPISLLKESYPDWGWPRLTRNITTVPANIADKLWALIHHHADSAPAPLPDAAKTEEVKRTKSGGGFGNAKTNKVVEQASIAKVKQYLIAQGFKVRSREAENLGYDLDAIKGSEVLHVEVKGSSGDGRNFIITKNEVATARIDPRFRLFVVGYARLKTALITEFSAAKFESTFNLSPICYQATIKPRTSDTLKK
jgi:hypothetical protein